MSSIQEIITRQEWKQVNKTKRYQSVEIEEMMESAENEVKAAIINLSHMFKKVKESLTMK